MQERILCAFPALLCDSSDEKGLKRRVVVEASVQGGTHLEIRREGALCASVDLAATRTSYISRDHVFVFAPHEDPKLGLLLHFEDGASFCEFLDQLPAEPTLARIHPSAVSEEVKAGLRLLATTPAARQSVSVGRPRHVVRCELSVAHAPLDVSNDHD